jgi:hypothetical protein
MEWVEWVDEYQSTCPGCQSVYAERTPPGSPPCETCRVELREENGEIAQVYMMTRRQYITRNNGRGDVAVDLSISAIKTVMDIYGVGDQRSCLSAVLRLFHYFESKRHVE